MKRTKPEDHPVSQVKWVSLEKVVANDYNPNKVARNEMRLLAVSILADGFTQPVVTFYNSNTNKYVVVDGFHRYYTVKTNESVRKSTGGMIPVVVIEGDENERKASTVRHNRARGKHGVVSMGVLVQQLTDDGWSESQICNELGLEAEELVRLQHMTGVANLFKDHKFNKSWETISQIKERRNVK